MRIYGNRLIKTLSGKDTRPTTSKVREAVFNIWRGQIEGATWLDLCAGNGTMGAEALCRGAKSAIALEKSSLACQIIRENWEKILGEGQTFQILRGDVTQRLKSLKGQNFDLIYFDPPYESNLYTPVLKMVVEYQLLKPEMGQIAIEYDPKSSKIEVPSPLKLINTKIYGHSGLNFYSRK